MEREFGGGEWDGKEREVRAGGGGPAAHSGMCQSGRKTRSVREGKRGRRRGCFGTSCEAIHYRRKREKLITSEWPC